MAFNTGNAIGSTDPRDLSDNSENLDKAVNDLGSPTWVDRFGNRRTTLAGQIGYIGTGVDGAIESYTSGLVLTTYSTIIKYNGEFYRPSASATLPYTTTATLPDVDSNLVAVGDAVLRQDLAGSLSGEGASLVSMEGGPTVEDAVNNRVIRVSSRTEMKAYDVPAGYQFSLEEGGRSGLFVVKAGTPPSDPQEGIYVVLNNGNYAERIYEGAVDVMWFGAFDDQVNDSTTAMDAAISFLGTTGGIRLPDQLRFTSAIVLPSNSKEFHFFSEGFCRIKVDHTGDGMSFLGDNENFGGHTWENIGFFGPNTRFPPAVYTPPSNGVGLKLETAYDCTLINVKCEQFFRGIKITKGFNNKCVGACEFEFNQIGVEITDPATNLNKFDGAKIRQNRVGGVLIDGTGGPPYPTKNSFNACYIETNIPYNDGYPVGGPGDGSNSFGVKIIGSYSNDFTNVYFENQEYDIFIDGQSSYNKFTGTRHAPSSDFSRLGKIRLKGASEFGNKFIACEQVSRNRTDIHVETDDASQRNTCFYDCTGFNFIDSSLTGPIQVRNNNQYSTNGGTPDGTLCFPAWGYQDNPSEGTTRGLIDGIGTTSATLNAQGFSEVRLGSQIATNTTITSITGLKPYQLFTLWNYQEGAVATIESSADTGNLILKGLADAKLDTFGQSITFWVNGFGRAYEIGRNFTNQNKGSVTISDGSSSAVATFPVPLGDFEYKAFVTVTAKSGSPAAGATRATVIGRNTGSITIGLEAAPGAGNSVTVDWMVEPNY